MFGPVSTSAPLAVPDSSAPGACSISLEATGNGQITAHVTPPTADADNTPLTGLAGVVVALVPAPADGSDPFAGKAGADLKAIGGAKAIALTPDNAGHQTDVVFDGLAIGQVYVGGVAACDQPGDLT